MEALTSAATAVVGLLTPKNTPSNSAATMSPAKRAHVSGTVLGAFGKTEESPKNYIWYF